MRNKGLIYKAWNKKSNKIYIGQTIQTLKERIRQHYKFAKEKHNYKFSNALNKYDKDDWEWSILEDNLPIEFLNIREVYYISLFDTYSYGYNSTPGGTERHERKGSNRVLNNIRKLYNIKTQEVVEIDAYHFIKVYYSDEKHLGNIYRFFKAEYLRYRDWIFEDNICLYNKELEDRKLIAIERFTDKNIYKFYNENLNISFFGLRKDFILDYSLHKGNVSSLINNKLNSYKGWVLINK